MDRIDVAIIGSGVIGLAVASAIAKPDKDIFVFEKNSSFGQETSSRNSEVIHSGIYYPADSLKAKTCIIGKSLLYEICQKHNIPCKKVGKLIIARDLQDDKVCLENLFSQGLKNGLVDIRMVDRKDIKRLEPHVEAQQAIYLSGTGIIDSHSLMEYFLSRAKTQGADVVYNTEVVSIDARKEGYRIGVSSASSGEYAFISRCIINCAGLNSDMVSGMVGIKNDDYVLSYCKGDYFRLGNKKNIFINGLVYPVCKIDDTSLGIHVTPDLTGGIRLGPDAEYLKTRKIDYSVDPAKRKLFYENVKTFLPFLKEEDISEDTSGIRPKLQGPGEGFKDFVIKHEIDAGFKGFVNLIGIESPGLTAAPAVAEMVKEIVDDLI